MPDETRHPYIPEGPLGTAPGGGFTHPADRHAAFTAALEGVDLGTYDWRIVDWLCGLDDTICRTVASLLWRARMAGRAEALPEGTVTEWGVRFNDDPGLVQRYHDEEAARTALEDTSQYAAVVSRQMLVTPWTEAAEPVTCRHCGEPIIPCPHLPAFYPVCKGWRHEGYDSQPIGAHYCGGRSINASAEPAEAAEPREDGSHGEQ